MENKIPETDIQKIPAFRVDPSLDKYDNVVLFPELLAKANALLKKAGPPKLPELWKNLDYTKACEANND